MEIFAGAFIFFWIAVLLASPLLIFMPFYMAAKARGIERALQDIAFQIQVARSKDEKSIFELAGRSQE